MRGISLALILAILALPASADAFIIPGQIDDFQNGTLQSWGGNAAPTNIPTGGPAGAGDRYLQLTSAPPPGPGPKLGTSNFVQWTGDYIAAGVIAVEADPARPSVSICWRRGGARPRAPSPPRSARSPRACSSRSGTAASRPCA